MISLFEEVMQGMLSQKRESQSYLGQVVPWPLAEAAPPPFKRFWVCLERPREFDWR